MSDHIQLYSNAGCPYAQRTRIALLEKGLTFDFKEVDLANKPDWFLQASPTGKVPVLVHNSYHLYESTIINEYIDEVWPEPALMPSDYGLRAQARIWINQFSDFASSLFHIGIDRDVAENTQQLKKALAVVEENLGQYEGLYLLGELLSLVDISFYTFFERMPVVESKVDIQLSNYPLCAAWYLAMSKRDSVVATARTAQQHIESFSALSQRLNR